MGKWENGKLVKLSWEFVCLAALPPFGDHFRARKRADLAVRPGGGNVGIQGGGALGCGLGRLAGVFRVQNVPPFFLEGRAPMSRSSCMVTRLEEPMVSMRDCSLRWVTGLPSTLLV